MMKHASGGLLLVCPEDIEVFESGGCERCKFGPLDNDGYHVERYRVMQCDAEPWKRFLIHENDAHELANEGYTALTGWAEQLISPDNRAVISGWRYDPDGGGIEHESGHDFDGGAE